MKPFTQKLTIMRKLSVVTALLLTGSILFAQKNDPAAKQVLDAVSAKFKTFNSVQAAFAYKVEDAKGKVMSTKNGTVWMKGNRYRVSFAGQEIFSDGKTTWNYDKNTNEVTINNVEGSANAMTPQKLFTNFYDNDFLYLLNGEKKVGTKTLQEIEMTPTDKSKPFHK
ncbi:MAG: outer membrane lipoprotein carrier protein LolA, partial [Chitinophagaceae bacterium]